MRVFFDPRQHVVQLGALGNRLGGGVISQDELRPPAAAVQGRHRQPGRVGGDRGRSRPADAPAEVST